MKLFTRKPKEKQDNPKKVNKHTGEDEEDAGTAADADGNDLSSTTKLNLSMTSAATGPGSAQRSGSLPYYAQHLSVSDTSGVGFDRASNFSCVSGASSDYVPRAAAAATAANSGDDNGLAAPATRRDQASVILPATCYVYDPSAQRWGEQRVRVRVHHPNRGVDQDNYHVYFAADLFLLKDAPVQSANAPGGAADKAGVSLTGYGDSYDASGDLNSTVGVVKSIPVLARMYRHNISDVADADYLGDGMCQAVAEDLAHKFSRFPVAPGSRRVPLPFLTNRNICRIDYGGLPASLRQQTRGFFSYLTTDSRDLVMMLEPDVRECSAIGVSFSTKVAEAGGLPPLASAEDDVYPPFDTLRYDKTDLKQVAEAFTHFSYVESRGRSIVHGLLHSRRYLTDPLVYTETGRGFGMGNGGARSIDRWKARHRCSAICRSFGLERINDLPPDDRVGAKGSPGASASNDSAATPVDKKAAKQQQKDREKAEKAQRKEDKRLQKEREKKLGNY